MNVVSVSPFDGLRVTQLARPSTAALRAFAQDDKLDSDLYREPVLPKWEAVLFAALLDGTGGAALGG
jgi:hypothetical protein